VNCTRIARPAFCCCGNCKAGTYNAVRSSVQNQGVEMPLNKSSLPTRQDLKWNSPPPSRPPAAPPVVDQPNPKVPVAPQDKP
jgi:hypothetical protein